MFRHPQNLSRQANSVEPRKLPDPPLPPYIRYCRQQWQIIRSENNGLQLWEISNLIKSNWHNLPEIERDAFQKEFDSEMTEYEKHTRQQSGSLAVSTAIKARVKGSKAKDAGTTSVVRAAPEEDEQNPSELTIRRTHAVRFDRNHRLVVDLFNATSVFDSRFVVPKKRLQLLQRQAHNLELHRNKLEDELTKLEESFISKKRQLMRSSAEFESQLKKVCEEKAEVSEDGYAEMVGEWEKKLAACYIEYKKKRELVDQALAAEREELAKTTPLLYAMTMASSPSSTTEQSMATSSSFTVEM